MSFAFGSVSHSFLLLDPCRPVGKRFQKKVSAKRLLVNAEVSQQHELWHSYGLGLAEPGGALRRDLINLAEPSPDSIPGRLEATIHASAEPHGSSDLFSKLDSLPEVHSLTCCGRYGHCVKEAFHESAFMLAKQLSDETSARHLPAGSLVRIVPHSDVAMVNFSQMFFLGSLCKKPLLHVLVQACFVPGQRDAFGFELGDDGHPCCSTSFQIFLNLCKASRRDGAELQMVQVEVLEYDFKFQLFSAHFVQACVLQTQCNFSLFARQGLGQNAQQRPKPPKPEAKLPFGLQMPPRQRAKRKAAPKRVRGQTKQKARFVNLVDPDSSASESAASAQREAGAPDAPLQDDGGVEDADGEIMAAPSDTAHREQRDVQQEFKAYEETVAKKESLAQWYRMHEQQSGSTEITTRPGASFFSKVIGFSDAAIAPTGRGVCYHCSQRIGKGEVRVSYFWHVQRPERYMHAGCIPAFVGASPEQRKEPAMRALVQIAVKFGEGSSSSSDDSKFRIKREVEAVIGKLVS